MPYFDGKAWFPIDIEKLTGKEGQTAFAKGRPQGLDEAQGKIEAFFKALNYPANKIILGGFSQGAMVATDYALEMEENPLGLLILSGFLIDHQGWASKMKRRAGTHFCQTHGYRDEILHYEGGKELTKLLLESGWEGALNAFQGGHAIPKRSARCDEVLFKGANLLKEIS